MKRGGGKGGKSQKTSYSKAIKTQAKTNTRLESVKTTETKIKAIQTKKKKVETQIEALKAEDTKNTTDSKKILKKIRKKEKKKTKLEQKEAKKEAKLAKRQQKLINTQKKLNAKKPLAGINSTNKTPEGLKQQEDFAKAVTAFKTRVETKKLKNTQIKLIRKQRKSKAKEKRLKKLTNKRENQLKKQEAKENRKKSGTLGFFEKYFNFTKKVSKSNVDQAKINKNSLNSNVQYYTNKVETLKIKKAKKEAQINKTKTITSVGELKTVNGQIVTPKINLGANPNSKDILADIKENEKYLGIDVNEIKDMDIKNEKEFMSSITNLKDTYQEQYRNLMNKEGILAPADKEALVKLIEINREYGLNFSKNNINQSNVNLSSSKRRPLTSYNQERNTKALTNTTYQNKAEGFKLFTSSLDKNYNKEALNKQYKTLALQLHPDKHSEDPNYNITKWYSMQNAYTQLLEKFNQPEI